MSQSERVDDVWVIHGEAYDLSSFVERHPGGKLAISLGKGRDCTAMFESYHALTNGQPWKMLEKFKVQRPAAVKALAQFRW
jgi:cytochrome b involved in lipid metabolism